MSWWRRVAIEQLPGLHTAIAAADGPCGLWSALRDEANRLCRQEPVDDAAVAAIYGYGTWCLTQARSRAIATAALVCFYEHIPTDPALRADAARRLSVEDFHGLSNIFSYHLSAQELQEFTQEFLAGKRA